MKGIIFGNLEDFTICTVDLNHKFWNQAFKKGLLWLVSSHKEGETEFHFSFENDAGKKIHS